MLSWVQLFVTPWTIVYQASLSMEFSRQEYWSELPFPSPGDLPDPGIKPGSPVSPASAGGFFTTELPGKTQKPALYFLNFQIAKVRSFKMEVILGKSTRKKKKKEIWRWGFNSWLLLSLVVWIWASCQSFLNLSFLIYKTVCMCVQLFVTPWTVARQTPLSTGSAGKYNGVGCHSLLQGSFLTQGSHPNLLHCRQVLHHWATWEDHIYKTRGC